MSDPRQTAHNLLDKLAALKEQEAAILAELRALVAGEDTIAVKVKKCETAFVEARQTRYPEPYVFNYAADRVQWKRLLMTMSPDELAQRALSYVSNDERFYLQCRHSFPVFVKTINQHVALAPKRADGLDVAATQETLTRLRG